MKKDLVDQVMQYALAVAHSGELNERELGPIHLIKYVYLADLAHAEGNDGRTLTEADWQFYSFGPYSPGVLARVEPAMAGIRTSSRIFLYEEQEVGVREGKRWTLASTEDTSELLERLHDLLPWAVCRVVKKAVREHYADTKSLLHAVYNTPPMLRAAPNEHLDFTPSQKSVEPPRPETEPTKRQLKKRKERLLAAKDRLRVKLAEAKKAKKEAPILPAPRYDDVFFAGTEWLDSLAGVEMAEEGEIVFSDEMWKSGGRDDPEIP